MPLSNTAGNLNTPEYYQQQRAGLNPVTPGTGATNSQAPMSGIGGIGVPQPPPTPAPAVQPAAPTNSLVAPDPDAIRRRLMGSVEGATGAAGMPYNAPFDSGVSNLYAQTMQKLAGYDESQNMLNTNYEKNRGYTLQNQDVDMKNLMDRMAFQGILSSGITTDQRGLLGQRYSQKLDQLASAQAQALNQLQTQRLGTQSDYEQGLGSLEGKYTSDLSNWVQQQAQQQAARQMQQAQSQANAGLLQMFQQAQTTGNQQQLEILKQIAAAQGVTV
jgi:hypothetical protein